MNNDFTFIIITILALVGGGGYLLLNQPFATTGGNNKTKKNRTSTPYFKNEFNDNDKIAKQETIDKPKKRQNKKINTQNVSSDQDESENDSDDSDDSDDSNDDNEDYHNIDVGELNENIKPKKYTRKQSKK